METATDSRTEAERQSKGRMHGLSTAMAVVSASSILLIMVTMLVDILSRVARGEAIPGAYALVEALLVVGAFFALGVAEWGGDNVRVTLFLRYLPQKVRNKVKLVGTAISILIVLWLFWATSSEAWSSYQMREVDMGVVAFHVWPVRIALAIGTLVLVIALIQTFLRELGRGNKNSETTVKNEDQL